MTFNPSPDSETYIGAGFELWDEDGDTERSIAVIQNKRTRVGPANSQAVENGLTQGGPTNIGVVLKYPG